MKIRRFYSQNMRTALRHVADEFGEDAAILSSQKTADGVEVIAALDYDQELLPSAFQGVEQQSDPDVTQESINKASGIAASQKIENNGQYVIHNDTEDYQSSNQLDKSGLKSPSIRSKNEQKKSYIEWSTDPSLVAMREELGLMRTMMSEQLKGIGWQRFSEKDPTSAMLARRGTRLGINQSILRGLIPQVKLKDDAECCWQNLLALLAKSISVDGKDLLVKGGVFAFMGPTGSGKTTTIAKIAARFIIKHGAESVALISVDNYRSSAQQQLANFARILGVPLQCVSAKLSLDTLLDQFKNKKLVLIDTAGMSRQDSAIAKQLTTLKRSRHAVKRFLMIPATHQLTVVKQSIELFKHYSPFSVIITKLDEATSLGEVLSLTIDNSLPVSFTTDGQRVPEDIRVARSHHLVSKAVWLTGKYGTFTEDWQLAQELPQAQYA